MNQRISIDAAVQHGRPVIHGTRVPVTRVLDSLASGMSSDEIAEQYGITKEDVAAAVEYARALVEREQHHSLP
jgi:uncharacterized protein (DUF433 family)